MAGTSNAMTVSMSDSDLRNSRKSDGYQCRKTVSMARQL